MKNLVANFFYYTGISRLLFHLSRGIYGKSHIRIVNYHSTPSENNVQLRAQLSFYRKYYSSVTEGDLISFLNTGTWEKEKPGIIISFDDGLKNNVSEAIPLIEEFGFTGWFCVPAEFHQIEGKDQYSYAKQNLISLRSILKTQSDIAMSAEDLREISKKHVILCHSFSHKRMIEDVSTEEELKRELFESKEILEKLIGKSIAGFCWVGGEIESYSKAANDLVKSNYQYSFHTNNSPVTSAIERYALNRSNIEVWFSKHLFLLTLSGFYDLMYWYKRKKVAQILKG